MVRNSSGVAHDAEKITHFFANHASTSSDDTFLAP
jgi:hypothetical protein